MVKSHLSLLLIIKVKMLLISKCNLCRTLMNSNKCNRSLFRMRVLIAVKVYYHKIIIIWIVVIITCILKTLNSKITNWMKIILIIFMMSKMKILFMLMQVNMITIDKGHWRYLIVVSIRSLCKAKINCRMLNLYMGRYKTLIKLTN